MSTINVYYRIGIPTLDAYDIKFSPGLYRKVWTFHNSKMDPEDIFEMFNSENENPLIVRQDVIEDNKLEHTSMSIGDVAEIDGTKFIVARNGWRILS